MAVKITSSVEYNFSILNILAHTKENVHGPVLFTEMS